MFTAMTTVTSFKKNGLNKFSLRILVDSENWKVSKPLDFIVLQHNVTESSLNWRSADHQQIHIFFKKMLILPKQEKRKLLRMKFFPLKTTNPIKDSCIMYLHVSLKGYWSHLNRHFLWSTTKPS